MSALRQPAVAPTPCDPRASCDCELSRVFQTAPAAPHSPFTPGQAVFRQGDPARQVFRIQSGAVVSYSLLADGRRQVTGFHLPGGFLGLEAGVVHTTTSEALTHVEAQALDRVDLAVRAATDNALARALWQASVGAFQRSEDHALILARQGATERVAAFLLDFSERLGGADVIDLPMTRQDIADYLGLTIHTVSRTLSQLQNDGLIEARSTRHVRLLRRARLEWMRA